MDQRDTTERVARLAREMRQAFGERAEAIAVRMATDAAPIDARIADIWLQIGDAIASRTA